jgi:hypothetical protein
MLRCDVTPPSVACCAGKRPKYCGKVEFFILKGAIFMSDLYMGIDIGTTGVRAALLAVQRDL